MAFVVRLITRCMGGNNTQGVRFGGEKVDEIGSIKQRKRKRRKRRRRERERESAEEELQSGNVM